MLHYRGLIHGIQSPRYWDQGEDDKDFKWNNYISRYHSRHLDLMDLLAMYTGRANAPLDELAKLIGFPGKLGMDGSKVWEAYQQGKLAEIRNYCETDVVNTYLVFARFQLMRGQFTKARYDRKCELVRSTLNKSDETHWKRIPCAMAREEIRMNPVIIESLDHEGRGIAHADGKVIFIEGALTGERVTYSSYRKKNNYEQAKVEQILKQSFMRVQPKCPVFGVCGGCSMQHLDPRAQVAVKQRVLEDNLQRIGKVKPEVMLPPIYGLSWAYRQRARLSVRHVLKKNKTLVGFREQNGKYVADMQHCEILTPKIAGLLPLLGELNEKFTARDIMPQIEVAVGEHVDVLVLRILAALTPSDEALIREFADTHKVQFWTQTKGPETVVPFYPLDAPKLSYSLPEFGITMPFAPTEFTQVNSEMNRLMVSRAMRLLNPHPGESIADFFCGLGNFTLPIARSGARVLGIEGSDALVKRAKQNADIQRFAGVMPNIVR